MLLVVLLLRLRIVEMTAEPHENKKSPADKTVRCTNELDQKAKTANGALFNRNLSPAVRHVGTGVRVTTPPPYLHDVHNFFAN